jgi:hypothetical protein
MPVTIKPYPLPKTYLPFYPQVTLRTAQEIGIKKHLKPRIAELLPVFGKSIV